jgi:hypothetical protein
MPIPRKPWSQLAKATKKRKLAWFKNHEGLNPSEVARRYNTGTLGSQTAARGHIETPERPSAVYQHPERYRRYIRQRKITFEAPTNDRALLLHKYDRNFNRTLRYSHETMLYHIYMMMTDDEVDWALRPQVDRTDLVEAARADVGLRMFRGEEQSPFWYHSMRRIV